MGAGPLPGSDHDLKAARIRSLVRALAAGILVLVEKGYVGAGSHVKTPYKGKDKPEPLKDGQPLPRQAPRTRRTRQRPAQEPMPFS